ncbi:MAG: hypothetical protein KA586_11435 [Candidatus Promineofilum sp.]|nr:hypothetical protein [Promineifilum sp.]
MNTTTDHDSIGPNRRLNRLGRGPRLTLLFAVLLMATSAAQVIYRYTLPTDGWYAEEDLDSAYWEYYVNIVGADSGLQSGDHLIGLMGQPLDAVTGHEMRPYWVVGNTVNYDIARGDQQLHVAVPLVHWTPRLITQLFKINPSAQIFTLGVAVLVAVGFLAFFKHPDDPAARALLVFVSAFGASGISGLVPDGLYTAFFPVASAMTSFFSYIIFGALIFPALLAFTWVFPHPKPIVGQYPWLAYAPFLLGALVLGALLLDPAAWQVGWIGSLAMLVASIISLLHSTVTMRDAVSRAQLLWAVGGLILGLGLFALNFPAAFEWVSPVWTYRLAVMANLGIPVIGLGLAMAVLRYRLFDIDVIIRRTTSYALLTALLGLVYFGSVVVFQRLLAPLTGESTAAVVLSTLLIAALFLPLRRRLQDIIDRRFFRRKYDAQKTLEAFAATVRDETDLDALMAELVRVIQDTMEPEHVTLWLREPIADKQRHWWAS